MSPANRLTLLRLLLVPVFLLLLHYDGLTLISAAVFAFMAVTDYFDGWLARRYDQVTDLGKLLDPLADKLAVGLPLIWFVAVGTVSVWPVIIIIAREFIVIGLRLCAAGQGLVIAAGWSGKLKSVLQMVAILMLILRLEGPEFILWLSILAGTWSGWKIWQQSKHVLRSY